MTFDVTTLGDRTILVEGNVAVDPSRPTETFHVLELPWPDGTVTALEVDDVPAPDQWPLAEQAFLEWRRVLDPNGLLNFRTRAGVAGTSTGPHRSPEAIACQFVEILGRLGFEIVSLEPSPEDESRLTGTALRGDLPLAVASLEATQAAVPPANISFHSGLLDASLPASLGRAAVLSLDEAGVKVRACPLFEVIDERYGD